MFTNEGYKDWRRFHCTLLCIRDADYDKLLDELQPMFRKMGATAEELDNASCWLIECPERANCAWRTHYGLIRQHIFAHRKRSRAAAEKREKALPPHFSKIASSFVNGIGREGKP